MAGLTDAGNFDAYLPPSVTVWNSGTATSTAVQFQTAGMDTIALTISAAAGITGGTIQFQVFDGAAWIPVKCARVSSYNTDSSYVIPSGGGIQGWNVGCAGYPQFQAILTGAITGSGSVTVTSIVSSAPDTSVVTAGIDPLSNMPNAAANNNTNGLSTLRYFTPAATTVQAIKATPGRVHKIVAINAAAAVRYLKFYNTASGSVVVGTTAVVRTIQLAIGQTVITEEALGDYYSNGAGFSCAVTTGILDSDTTAPAANDCLIQVDYV